MGHDHGGITYANRELSERHQDQAHARDARGYVFAEVGDDVSGRTQRQSFGGPRRGDVGERGGFFVASGTMGNLVSVLTIVGGDTRSYSVSGRTSTGRRLARLLWAASPTDLCPTSLTAAWIYEDGGRD